MLCESEVRFRVSSDCTVSGRCISRPLFAEIEFPQFLCNALSREKPYTQEESSSAHLVVVAGGSFSFFKVIVSRNLKARNVAISCHVSHNIDWRYGRMA